MANDNDPAADRRRRLEDVRVEIEQELASGRSLVTREWEQKYHDLNPELAAMLARLSGAEETVPADQPLQSPAGETLAFEGGTGMAGPTLADADPLQTGAFSLGEGQTEIARDSMGRAPATNIDASGATIAHATSTKPTVKQDHRPSGQEPLAAGVRVRYIGDYELLGVLGRGGMGVVYRARQISLNRNVALKMIRNAEFASGDQLRRFQNEAESVALLDHPGIVPIYEVSDYEDQRYFSMKLIEGDGLDKRLKHYSENPRAAARLIAEVADAVHHAHQRGLLHRDLKPANILVDGEGHPHVTDFGLARRIEGESGLTVSGAIMGTPAYMAPEQAMGRNSQVTTASDVYGLGAILYAVLAGQAPFGGDSVLETLEQVRQNPPAAPSRFNAKLAPDLEVICLKCLEKDPKRRYASAQALADDLNRWLNGEPIKARPVSTTVRAWMWCKRKPALAGLSAALPQRWSAA